MPERSMAEGAANGKARKDDPFFAVRGLAEAEQQVYRERLRLYARQEARDELELMQFAPPPFYGPSFDDDLSRPQEELRERLAGLLWVDGNAILAAQAKTGKTTLALNVAWSLTSGAPFLGRHELVTPLSGRVAFWNYELTRPQFSSWARSIGFERGCPASRSLHVEYLRGYRVPFWTKAIEDWAVDRLRRCETEVWVLDPLQRSMAGVGSIKDNDDMDRFFEAIDVIKRRAGVRDVLILAHASDRNLEAEHALGASRIDGWPDTRWFYTTDSSGARYLRVDGRDSAMDEEQLRFDPETKALSLVGGGTRIDRKAAAETTRLIEVVAACKNDPGLGKGSLVSEVGGKGERRGSWVDKAEARGLIENRSEGSSHHWYATPLGLKWLDERTSKGTA